MLLVKYFDKQNIISKEIYSNEMWTSGGLTGLVYLGAFSRSFSLITLVALLKAKPSKLGPKYVNLKYHGVSMAY